jgi:hypothetical protein
MALFVSAVTGTGRNANQAAVARAASGSDQLVVRDIGDTASLAPAQEISVQNSDSVAGRRRRWTPTPAATTPAAPAPGAWTGSYFNNTSLSGTPAVIRSDGAAIDFDWWGSPASEVPSDYFSVRWTRTYNFGAGTYQFALKHDDGGRLFVDGQLVMQQWYMQVPTSFAAQRTLSQGPHTVTVEYYTTWGEAVANLAISQVGAAPAASISTSIAAAPTATNTTQPTATKTPAPTATRTPTTVANTPTRTPTPAQAATPFVPTPTATAAPSTPTSTAVPPTATKTPVPTPTRTSTPVPPTATKTSTPVPPTSTPTPVSGSTLAQIIADSWGSPDGHPYGVPTNYSYYNTPYHQEDVIPSGKSAVAPWIQVIPSVETFDCQNATLEISDWRTWAYVNGGWQALLEQTSGGIWSQGYSPTYGSTSYNGAYSQVSGGWTFAIPPRGALLHATPGSHPAVQPGSRYLAAVTARIVPAGSGAFHCDGLLIDMGGDWRQTTTSNDPGALPPIVQGAWRYIPADGTPVTVWASSVPASTLQANPPPYQ